MSIQSLWRSLRAKTELSVQRHADELMHDTHWDWLRGLQARRTLVVVLAVSLVATGILFIIGGSWGFAPLVASGVVFIALRISVRSVADLPDELLDERQVRVRDRAYRGAFMSLSGVVLVLIGVGFFWVVTSTREVDAARLLIDENDAFGVFWFSIGLCLALPSMVVAWANDRV
jgi:succinate dehydrogenase hydrophobic anchor subunit